MFKLDLEKAEKPEIKLPTSAKSQKKEREFQNFRKTVYFSFIVNTKAFDCVDNKLWKILKEMGIPDHLTFLLKSMLVKKQQLELDMEKWTGSKLEKECVTAVYYHAGYLTYLQSTSCKMLGWMKHKVE